jgi:hypothetical protein
MEIDAVITIKLVLFLSLIVYSMFWGSLAFTIFEYAHRKQLTKKVTILGLITILSGVSMIVLSLMLMPSFQWIYELFGFTLK